MFAAIFIKGPLALVGVASVIIHALITRRPGAFFNRGTLVGVALVILLIGGWLGWAHQVEEATGKGAGREYLEATVLGHGVGRVKTGLAHIRPWWFYFARLPVNLLPFAPLLLLLL